MTSKMPIINAITSDIYILPKLFVTFVKSFVITFDIIKYWVKNPVIII
jgi:hypothetical protein